MVAMQLSLRCQACGKTMELPPTAVGERLPCPKCGTMCAVCGSLSDGPSLAAGERAADGIVCESDSPQDQLSLAAAIGCRRTVVTTRTLKRRSALPWVMAGGKTSIVLLAFCGGPRLFFFKAPLSSSPPPA